MEKNKIVVGVLLVSMLVGIIGSISAYDADNPWTGTVNWIIPGDTAFTVGWAGSETTVDFNPGSKTETGVQPDSQNNATSTPILNVTNSGNQALKITCNLTSAKPAWATIKVNDDSSYATAASFDTVATTVNVSVAVGETTPMYLWTDVSNAVAGTENRTLRINSEIA